MPDATKHPRSTCSLNQWVRSLVGLITSAGTGEYFPHLQSRCRNCGGGDRGRVAIYRPFGELRRAKIVLSPVRCSRPTTGVPLAHATMNFVGLDLTASDGWHQKTTTMSERISCTSSRSMLTLPEKALLVKLYYQNGECASAALRSYRHTKGIRRG
ncbi:hypothetical protein TNCV_1562991 [Trichonephila clavipes]|nr:hypothetical protein TNCV_1562991 [Trichonephila clavipes]